MVRSWRLAFEVLLGEAELEWQLQRIEKHAKKLIGSPDEDKLRSRLKEITEK